MSRESPQIPVANHLTPDNGLSPPESDEAKLRVCDHCRIKKTKCDQVRPACGNCRTRRIGCSYTKRRRKPGPPKGCTKRPKHSTVDGSTTSPERSSSGRARDTTICTDGLVSEPSRASNRISAIDDVSLLSWSGNGLGRPLSYGSNFSIDMETYLLNLYFKHVQPNYQLFEPCPDRRLRNAIHMSPRLKIALFAVSSRFATPGVMPWSPEDFAQRAESLSNDSELSVDELKASFLLCLHAMSDSLTWATVTETTKITRMADLYYTMHLGGKRNRSGSVFYLGSEEDPGSGDGLSASRNNEVEDLDAEMEEWNRVWWCIYRLDSCCCAITASPNPISSRLEEKIKFHSESLAESELQPGSNLEQDRDLFRHGSKHRKHWRTMRAMFSQPACTNQSLYLGVCSFVRSVTELRSLAKSGRGRGLENCLQELESDSAATAFALPPWYFQPVRNISIGETGDDHACRLKNLLVWSCSDLLLAICAAEMSSSSTTAAPDLTAHWHSILDKANDAANVVGKWKPAYLDIVDPMCSYIVLLVGAILAFQRALSPEASPNSSQLDLLELFMVQIGTRWPIANRLGKSLQSIQRNLASCKSTCTLETALTYVRQLTHPFDGQPVHPAMKGEAPGVGTSGYTEATGTINEDYLASAYDEGLGRHFDLNDVDFASLEGALSGMDPMDMLLQVGC
ncbi:hypothetical protein BDP55DRAFT_673745 [Colletotrichum godetiae]|uniref:Zn(2)-C6 fungal-type domain-containing protein n=1 Tax=Colletotrichum godetiae TaxID=1209918 RepID=A0AAJ0AF91_9PEZI|nr:uncharacterized protein BDP55DRAFT_673745 [Colletotrichum godetiae]KAK1672149.1 hypothetical protein BDP55DRAFT_673745 [Colletotrichum godetiae]